MSHQNHILIDLGRSCTARARTDHHLQRLAPIVQIRSEQDRVDRKVFDLLVENHLFAHPRLVLLEFGEQAVQLFLRVSRRLICLLSLSQIPLGINEEDPGGRHDLLKVIDRLGTSDGFLVTPDDGQFDRSEKRHARKLSTRLA